MIVSMLLLFAVGYAFIALEHKTRVNKAAVALVMCAAVWTLYALAGGGTGSELLGSLGDTCEILVFLIGAMTIVELIDVHGGFNVITDRIRTRDKRRLLWLLATITFFMSAVLDNMTTTIVMVMLLRRLVAEQRERWIFASIVVIAANSGGAWSPIGDVTTIMLWMRGNISSLPLMESLFVPCAVSTVVPVALAARTIGRGEVSHARTTAATLPPGVGQRMSRAILVAGTAGLLFVPVFKELTGLPPYMGMILVLGALWLLTEILYDRRDDLEEESQNRVAKVIRRIDMPTILFFLGILMTVGALQSAGLLDRAAAWLDATVHEVFTIAGVIGLLSSVVDNVPLVAACMGMYPVADAAAVAASADAAFAASFVRDGVFWHLLAYCAGVGGSLLIIGSASGVVAMGLEKIEFVWYLKRISLLALLGYAAGIVVILAEHLLFGL
ncbi:sodium:proton antiporter NhaD [uncultured Alistipes sp.]|uniref:sodium:proton antiporter NhaD n=1 Tax=uncultured Alistipes sp. TaxID=538949 RepID=UPI002603BF4A|nr:sodium:proton antiporter NhaD [uncultured Alistipes sp.]